MPATVSSGYAADRLVAIRNEPVQARSTARLSALLDAAAAAVHEVGFERLTTAMVAERARASIGTVYRYFPDRIAVLQALAARNLERVSQRILGVLGSEEHADWPSAMDAAFDVFVDAFRKEPGYRSVRAGDVIDLRPAPSDPPFNSRLAEQMFAALVPRFGLEDNSQSRLAFDAAIEATDALIARAFSRNDDGDPELLDMARTTLHLLLRQHFGEPQPRD